MIGRGGPHCAAAAAALTAVCDRWGGVVYDVLRSPRTEMLSLLAGSIPSRREDEATPGFIST